MEYLRLAVVGEVVPHPTLVTAAPTKVLPSLANLNFGISYPMPGDGNIATMGGVGAIRGSCFGALMVANSKIKMFGPFRLVFFVLVLL